MHTPEPSTRTTDLAEARAHVDRAFLEIGQHLARRRRQRVRVQQHAIHRLRYRGHPARTGRLTR